MRKKGIIISEPLGILIALLIMLAVFAVLYVTDEQNREALMQSIEIADRAEGVPAHENNFHTAKFDKINANIGRCKTCG